MKPVGLHSLLIVLLFGALVLLAFLKFTNPSKVNRKANYWFGLFLLLWASFWIEEITAITNLSPLNEYFSAALHYVQIYISLAYYLSVVFYINPNFRFRMSDIKHLVIPGVYLIALIVQSFSETNPDSPTHFLTAALMICQSLLYTIITLVKLRKHQKKIKLFSSDTTKFDLRWLEYIIVTLLLFTIVFGIYSYLSDAAPPNVYLNFLLLTIVFFIAYYSLKQKEVYPFDEKQRAGLIAFNDEPCEDPKRKILADTEIENLKNRLSILMTEEKPYLDNELNLVKLADLLAVNSHQASYLINKGFNETFFHYINRHRIEMAKELLVSRDKNNLTILGIAFESGFNSKTSFNTAFRKITNQTPSEFKKRSSVL